MTVEEPLAGELSAWEVAKVNVGDFSVHRSLQKAFSVKAIARWVVVKTNDCAAVLQWPVIAARTLEPRSGQAVSPAELASWLADHRAVSTAATQ